MLSNPTNLQRHRQHRRQQSTPTAYDASKVPALPNLQRKASHRRGMSLDQRRRQSPTQEQYRVSITNQGFNDTQQHILRETQQQRLARQGQQQPIRYFNPTSDENYLISPIVTPLRQSFDSGCMNLYGGSREATPYSPYPDNINSINGVNANDCAGSNPFGGNDSLLYPDEGAITPSAYLDFSMSFDGLPQEDWGATIKPSSRPSTGRRISGNIADRIARFESLAAEQSSSRPLTPPSQKSIYFPLTPAQTPYNRSVKMEPTLQRFLDDYDTSMEATIKPIPRRRQQSKSTFQEMRDQVEMNDPPSPANTAPSSSPFEGHAKMPKSTFVSISKVNSIPQNNTGYESPYHSPTHSDHSPQNSKSQSSSPEMSQRSLRRDVCDNEPHLGASNQSSYPEISESSHHSNPTLQSSPMQRSLSVNSINLDETITETGITIDDIAIYITGPDPLDQKWVCLFPDCNKRFGRKENVKSHVQTHLGDRQFQCPHCRKCFVRQHDLKRHAKIHSGVKPYPCACGNSFARHDALTRHRQRGMCIGAFEGVVKKVAKRGRPRKNRPDDEKRVEKAKRTRSKNSKGSTKAPTSGFSSEAVSSASEYSESSYGMSPSADYDVLDPQPFADFMTPNPFQQQQQQQPNLFLGNVNGDLEYSLPASVAVDDCVSPHVIQNDCVSPQAIQNATSPAYSGHSRHDSAGSMERSPPGMCESFPSSSSPGASAYYEIPTGDAEAMFLNAFGEDEGLGMRGLETEGERQAEAELLGLIGGKGFEGFGGDVGDLFGEAGDVWRN